MTVIEASSVSVKTMMDGTLRVTFDVEPRHAQDAFALFGSPGTPSALAALKTGAQASAEPDTGGAGGASAPAKTDKPIARWLALRCKEPDFRAWLTEQGDFASPLDEDECRNVVCGWCEVGSRGDIDGNRGAEAKFQRHIRNPWQKHCAERGVTA